jgi:transposase
VGETITVWLDIAKHALKAHGADVAGEVTFRKKLRRDQVLGFFAGLPHCTVALKACGGAHHWALDSAGSATR